MGRPPKYTPEELKKALFGEDGYFEEKEKERIEKDNDMIYMTISDICVFLEIDSSTWRRMREKSKYYTTIKRAEEIIANEWKKNMFYPGRNATGAIFYAKNVFGWSDKQEIQQNHKIEGDKSIDLNELPADKLAELKRSAEMIEAKEQAEEADYEEVD